jgi:hypothetical protein
VPVVPVCTLDTQEGEVAVKMVLADTVTVDKVHLQEEVEQIEVADMVRKGRPAEVEAVGSEDSPVVVAAEGTETGCTEFVADTEEAEAGMTRIAEAAQAEDSRLHMPGAAGRADMTEPMGRAGADQEDMSLAVAVRTEEVGAVPVACNALQQGPSCHLRGPCV